MQKFIGYDPVCPNEHNWLVTRQPGGGNRLRVPSLREIIVAEKRLSGGDSNRRLAKVIVNGKAAGHKGTVCGQRREPNRMRVPPRQILL